MKKENIGVYLGAFGFVLLVAFLNYLTTDEMLSTYQILLFYYVALIYFRQ